MLWSTGTIIWRGAGPVCHGWCNTTIVNTCVAGWKKFLDRWNCSSLFVFLCSSHCFIITVLSLERHYLQSFILPYLESFCFDLFHFLFFLQKGEYGKSRKRIENLQQNSFFYIHSWSLLLSTSSTAYIMYQSIPRPPIPPPGQPPGIWPTLSSVQWGIWPKPRPTRWSIWLTRQNVCQRSETKRISQFFDTAREPHSQIIALVDSTWVFFCCCRFI